MDYIRCKKSLGPYVGTSRTSTARPWAQLKCCSLGLCVNTCSRKQSLWMPRLSHLPPTFKQGVRWDVMISGYLFSNGSFLFFQRIQTWNGISLSCPICLTLTPLQAYICFSLWDTYNFTGYKLLLLKGFWAIWLAPPQASIALAIGWGSMSRRVAPSKPHGLRITFAGAVAAAGPLARWFQWLWHVVTTWMCSWRSLG